MSAVVSTQIFSNKVLRNEITEQLFKLFSFLFQHQFFQKRSLKVRGHVKFRKTKKVVGKKYNFSLA